MPKSSSKGPYPKNHAHLSAEEENLERILHEVEDENREFYAQEMERAKTTSLLQSGVHQKVANVLDQTDLGMMETVIEERVDSELEKAVAGNEIYDTSNGEDNRNYRYSINGRLTAPKKSRAKKMAHSILSALGGKSQVTLDKEDRFGTSKKFEDKKLFVAGKLRTFLEDLESSDPLEYANLMNEMNLAPVASVDDVIDQFTRLSYRQLRGLRAWSLRRATLQLHEQMAFLDLLMLNDLNQRASSKYGVMKVFDYVDLRKFWDEMLSSAVTEVKDLAKKFEDMLLAGSLFKLEGNPGAAVLLSEIRKQFEIEKDKPGSSDAVAATKMQKDLDIIFNDLPDDGATPPNKIKLNPFALLQRMFRLQYCESRGLDPKIYNEEANHYASVKAAARVEDVKSVDTPRSSNARAAEYMLRGKFGRASDMVANKVAKVQDFVGLEVIDFSTVSADRLMEQLINTSPDYKVFRGINKFTTPREIRALINQSGKEVPEEVLERFMRTLQEAISRFKKVRPNLDTELDEGDWDLENLVVVLQRLKMERWSRSHLAEINKLAPGDREKQLVEFLKDSYEKNQQISNEIMADVTHKNALWRTLLVKSELKKVLDKDVNESTARMKKVGIDARQQRIARMESEANPLPDGDARKNTLLKEIANLKAENASVQKQIDQSKDLYERVESAKKYIAENKLGRAAKKEYLDQVGLTAVWDKMGTNFALQKAWDKTKKAAKWTGGKIWKGVSWGGSKLAAGYNYMKKNYVNLDAMGSGARKTFSVGRLLATPATYPVGLAWKVGTFPLRLAGRALGGTVRLPQRLAGMFSKSVLRDYLAGRITALSQDMASLDAAIAKLQAKHARVPYGWDRNRIQKKVNKLIGEKASLNKKIESLNNKAKAEGINDLWFGGSAVTDNTSKGKKAT